MIFSDLYQEYAEQQTDAPSIYHRAMAYLILSTIVNKKIHIPFGHQNLYPNLYILIIGPSSLHRKSYAQSIATRLVRKLYPEVLIYETSSRESFIAELSDQERVPAESGVMALDELKGFIDRAKRSQHFLGFIQDLSSLYAPSLFKRRKGVSKAEKEIFEIKEPFLNITACCSFDWLSSSVDVSDIVGGFFARFLWILSNDRKTETKPEPTPPDGDKEWEILRKLENIKDYIGMGIISTEANQYWSEWYRRFMIPNQMSVWNPNFERLTVIAKKIALLHSIERVEDEIGAYPEQANFHISKNDLARAIAFVEDSAECFEKISITEGQTEKLLYRVASYLAKVKTVKRSEILQNVRGVDAKILNDILSTLETAECIEILKSENVLSKRPQYQIKVTENIKRFLSK